MAGAPTADDVLSALRQAPKDLATRDPGSAAIPMLHGIIEQFDVSQKER